MLVEDETSNSTSAEMETQDQAEKGYDTNKMKKDIRFF